MWLFNSRRSVRPAVQSETRAAARRRPRSMARVGGIDRGHGPRGGGCDDANQRQTSLPRLALNWRSLLHWGPRLRTTPRPSASRCRPMGSSWRSLRPAGNRTSRVDASAVVNRLQAGRRHRWSDGGLLVARWSFDWLRRRRHAQAPGAGNRRGRDHLQGPEPDWTLRHVEPERRDPVCNGCG